MSSSDDDLIVSCAAVILNTVIPQRRRRKCWTRALLKRRTGSSLLEDLSLGDPTGFNNFARVSRNDFEQILMQIGPQIARQDTNFRKSVSVTDRLLITLRFLATGDTFQSLMYTFRVAKSTISLIIPEVCQALVSVLEDTIKVTIF